MKSYKTIEKATEARTEVRRSLFIVSVSPAATAEEADAFVASVRAKYPDATHNCYAVIGAPESNEFKFGDDGEPSGTAGQPMLNALTKNGLYCVCAVVTRYFGGIKLGAGGLVQAYSKAVTDALRAAGTARYVYSAVCVAEVTYSDYGAVSNLLGERGAETLGTEYADGVKIIFAVPENDAVMTEKKIAELTSGEAGFAVKEKKYISYKR